MKKSITTVPSYRESLSGDVRKRFEEKTAGIQVDPYSLSKDDFKHSGRESWPDVTNFDIIQFFVFKESAYTRDQLRNHKSLEAYKYFQDGWVQEILHKEINGVHLMKAKVNHSMRIREKPLEPWFIISKDKGIESAHCTCMAGLGECCSHVGSVLFAMEQSTKARDETSVTDVPAYWLYPSSAKFDAPFKRLKDMDFQSAAKKRRQDNQSVSLKSGTCITETIPSPTKHEENTFFEELHKICPKSAILCLTDKFSEDFKPKAVDDNMPKEIKNSFDNSETQGNITYDEIVEKYDKIELKVTLEEVKFVERVTRKQSESAVWFKQRCGRITSSVFHAVCHTKINTPSVSLLKKITSDTNAKVVCAATEWGKKKEKVAREMYRHKMEKDHNNCKITDSGLHLSDEHFQFAASPDGMVECSCCGKGCIEIKCPYSLREKFDLDVNWMCDIDNKKFLNPKHSHYYQVQMQMLVTKLDYCDFIVWWPNGFHVERIEKNTEFLEENVKKALDFHRMCVLPELGYKYFTEKCVLAAKTIGSANSDTSADPKYCARSGTDDGSKMIMCESENCDKQWYHMKCIKMKKVPKGNWICPSCK